MSDLAARFKTAQDEVVNLNDAPDVQTKLKLYALYKQGSEGDVSGDRPSAIQFVAQAKYDAWAKLVGTSNETAINGYIDLVEELKAKDA
ncbi:acyl-CoA-binding protein [Deefgea tanakiae]|jgi:diazepam-binding inhibitor (GABA receptor modulating acyl-CoA-binding protein)|uniref:Acyl-CoA-binding protein n=1 Tax=Deefgea tanakiae TaxID=2865840 RepID=A0ABX8Z6G8_9NEIS|nr:acyl-CoA-binding protein [Deefgea tanakiae]QZA76504.1 acyl-CoA-binding protein [Deefgea tanakiae]